MADLRFPVMADISYDRGGLQPDLGKEFTHRRAIARSLKLESHKASLQRTVEFEIVPRLLSAYQTPKKHGEAVQAVPVAEDIKTLAELALGKGQEAASANIQGLFEQGIPLEQIYLKTIAPAASYLRQLWLDDERDFADVTLGLWRLQQLLREFSVVFRQDANKLTGQRTLLTLVPGETNELPYLMFKLVLTSEFLRRDGCSTWIEPNCTRPDAMALLQNEWFDAVEILVVNEKRLGLLAAQIKTMRNRSINQSMHVAISGSAAHRNPELVTLLGADGLAADRTKEFDAQTFGR